MTHKSLYSALAAAQAEMGPALRDAANPAFRSKYADLSAVLAAVMPALNNHGIAMFQRTTTMATQPQRPRPRRNTHQEQK